VPEGRRPGRRREALAQFAWLAFNVRVLYAGAFMGGASATQAFFQLAVAAIPALLFGGAFLESTKDRQPEAHDGERFLLGALVVLVLLAGGAEVVAVRGAVDDTVGGFSLHYVAFVLCGGTLALALNVAAPWAKAAMPDRWARSEKWKSPVASAVVVLSCAALGVALQVWVHSGVSRAQFIQNLNGAFTSYVGAKQAQSAAYDESAAARETALLFVVEHSWAFTPTQRFTLAAQMHELVDRVDRIVFHSAQSPTERQAGIIAETTMMTRRAKLELGPRNLATVLVTIDANKVKATSVAYVKAEDASNNAFQALRAACSGGRDPRCTKDALDAQSA
jgi:hypothetical protein